MDAKFDGTVAKFDEEIIITYKDTNKVFFTQIMFFSRREAYNFLVNHGFNTDDFNIWRLPCKIFWITKDGYLRTKY